MTRLVIDRDPGVDDAYALIVASAHPGARAVYRPDLWSGQRQLIGRLQGE